jgi:2-polyprenyl-3-methyl-5-hydroxy-6-metoxy-1,4-benzoquinol methylase
VSYVDLYDPDTDFDVWYTHATGSAIVGHLHPGQRLLELGCATGLMSVALAARGVRLVGVDRFPAYLERARARAIPGATFVQGEVCEFDDGTRFDHIVATNLLHELPDPDQFLHRCAQRLVPSGMVHLSVPNPHSLHRLIAVEMGLIDDLHALSENSARLGHHRHLDRADVTELAWRAGLAVIEHRGIALKPLPNDRLAQLPGDILRGLEGVARHFPDHCAFNYLVLTHA